MTELRRIAECASTQDEAFAAAALGAPSGTAIVAAVQTGGRGSRGQRWASADGGLWLSVLRRAAGTVAPDLVSVRVGLAVAEALATLGGLPDVQLKWPNDLLVDGRKVGGVLVEAHWSAGQLELLVVGVGLNVRNAPPADARWPAVCLAEWLPAVQVEAVLGRVVAAVRAIALTGDALSAAEMRRFASRDALRGQRLHAPAGGRADGIESDGRLRVRLADDAVVLLRSGPVIPLDSQAPWRTAEA